jgi:ankyrin repeat protein
VRRFTALHHAVDMGAGRALARLLADARFVGAGAVGCHPGAGVGAEDSQGRTAAQLAVGAGRPEMARAIADAAAAAAAAAAATARVAAAAVAAVAAAADSAAEERD